MLISEKLAAKSEDLVLLCGVNKQIAVTDISSDQIHLPKGRNLQYLQYTSA